ncbi:hypothetical protein [Legionella sp. 31fI33]|nr:hypothetical protein [Legionella sp. 31fI33]MCC5016050.1 hypothetical protein [Legionella sp. 31fI33]
MKNLREYSAYPPETQLALIRHELDYIQKNLKRLEEKVDELLKIVARK